MGSIDQKRNALVREQAALRERLRRVNAKILRLQGRPQRRTRLSQTPKPDHVSSSIDRSALGGCDLGSLRCTVVSRITQQYSCAHAQRKPSHANDYRS
jgi:hypothetical protein